MKGHTFWDATEKAKRYVSYLVKKSHLDPTDSSDSSDSSDSGVVKRCCTLPQLPSSRSNADVSAPRLRVSCVLAFIISRLRCVFCCCCSGRQRRDRCAVMTRGACPPLTRRGARLLAVVQVCAPACLALVLRSSLASPVALRSSFASPVCSVPASPQAWRTRTSSRPWATPPPLPPPRPRGASRLLPAAQRPPATCAARTSTTAASATASWAGAASRARRLEQVRDGHPQLPRVCHVHQRPRLIRVRVRARLLR